MSFTRAHPEVLAAAAGDLHGIGAQVASGNSAASAPITGVVPAAADPVSALAAAQFASHGQLYQTVSAQAAAIYEQFVANLTGSSNLYAMSEAANAAAAG